MTFETDPFDRWDLTPVINVSGTMTSIGASRVHSEVIQVVSEILDRFVSMDELQSRASGVIAKATGAEAGCVTGCSAAAITQGVAAAITGCDLAIPMLEQAQRMQTRIAELQRELAARQYEASSGGGMVTAVVTGQLRVLEVRIEPSFHASGDRGMLEDLTAAAVNAALEKAQRSVQEELQRLQGHLGLAAAPAPGK